MKPGTRVRVTSGTHEGKTGVVVGDEETGPFIRVVLDNGKDLRLARTALIADNDNSLKESEAARAELYEVLKNLRHAALHFGAGSGRMYGPIKAATEVLAKYAPTQQAEAADKEKSE